MTSSPDLFTARGLCKRYGRVTVLKDCDVAIRGGEIHALLGANGAGKSTLVRMMAGLLEPTAGSMQLDSNDYAPNSKRDAEIAGVEIVQQELNLIATLSVAENLMLARLPSIGGVIRRGPLKDRSRAALDRVGLNDVPVDTPVAKLGVGKQQMVEIAAALDRKCRILILDEPTAALSAAESATLFRWLNKLRDAGVGIVYISHRLDEVAQLADRITVLRDGQKIGTFDATECSTDRMVELMSGDGGSDDSALHPSRRQVDTVLRVDALTGGLVDRVSFNVNRGERLGIAGLVGSGRTELLRLIFGADVATSGNVYLRDDATAYRFRHPRQAVAAGIAMVTEDRKDNGLLLSKSIQFNTTLASLRHRFATTGMVRGRIERSATQTQCDQLDIRCHTIDQSVGTLSGGNQQKVAIAKWLVRDADVFLFDEPTRGIDVAARRRIYRLIDTLAKDGKGVVIVSSDLEELLETCDRIAVMSAGRLMETFERNDWSHDQIMQAAFSGYRNQEAGA
ncbi:sugar ABC transporter ATP-binding protein [Crateriforma conspicua]|uniref:sugar ABC transporter ATP-binding protein n=1 Tax=Crateriforma conspicua TaxID=2527996 RepID=UPI00118CA536|nr:sugar ABC transporter ATP-binding protein [Crateriforma conspicua]QDV62092.1 Arabinose import ATP-binding protein AraG [Crateriforma conspicua]